MHFLGTDIHGLRPIRAKYVDFIQGNLVGEVENLIFCP